MLINIVDEILIEAHNQAIEKGMEKEFIGIFEEELSKRDRLYVDREVRDILTAPLISR